MALTKSHSGVTVLAQGTGQRCAAVVHPPLCPPDLRLASDMLGLQLPRLRVVLSLQLACVPAGFFGRPRLQQVAADSHTN